MSYDFHQLDSKEFEMLSIDLLSELYSTRIESFKPGKDKGIDGRFFSSKNEEIIIQCKHYLGTGYKGLISKLKKEEVAKVKKLKPKKYIFATSLPLSYSNKKEIKKIFHPFIKRDDDIFGQEDLNQLIARFHLIEERHSFKLCDPSTTVIKTFIDNSLKNAVKGITEKSPLSEKDLEDKIKLGRTEYKLIEMVNIIHTINGKKYDFENDLIEYLTIINNRNNKTWYFAAAIYLAQSIQGLGLDIFFKSFQEPTDKEKKIEYEYLGKIIRYHYRNTIQEMRHTDKNNTLKKRFLSELDLKNDKIELPENEMESILNTFYNNLIRLSEMKLSFNINNKT